ncbi:MAG: MerR family transcriptional regulator [Candidatus Omnitrophota bacterium]
MVPLRKYFTTGDLAKKLKVSKRNIQNWSKAGKIPGKRDPLSNYWIYTDADVEKLRKIINRGLK